MRGPEDQLTRVSVEDVHRQISDSLGDILSGLHAHAAAPPASPPAPTGKTGIEGFERVSFRSPAERGNGGISTGFHPIPSFGGYSTVYRGADAVLPKRIARRHTDPRIGVVVAEIGFAIIVRVNRSIQKAGGSERSSSYER